MAEKPSYQLARDQRAQDETPDKIYARMTADAAHKQAVDETAKESGWHHINYDPKNPMIRGSGSAEYDKF